MKMIYDRKSGTCYEQEQYGGKILKFLYNNALGRMFLRLAVSKTVSKICGKYYSSALSKKKIEPFINKYKIDMRPYENRQYNSFNDYFTRKKVNLNFEFDNMDFISPADSKLTVYEISDKLEIPVKNSVYTLNELTSETKVSDCFKGGYCFVFRLSMDDCHRYCYIDDGKLIKSRLINGKLHTVSSISDARKVFCENTRRVSFLNTDNFSEVVCVEVGAMLVGRMSDSEKTEFKKGEEKGYFELGGSTIIILTQKKIKIDDDILKCSKNGVETKVEYAQRIGEKIC